MTKIQLEEIQSAVQEVLPGGAGVIVCVKDPDIRSTYGHPIIVSTHFEVEGYQSDERDPVIRSDYDTPEKLTRLVKQRCVKILRAIVAKGQIPDVPAFIIETRHGVRVSRDFGLNRSNEVYPIYVVRVPVKKMNDPRWAGLSDEEVMRLWRVEWNVIPQLDFSPKRWWE